MEKLDTTVVIPCINSEEVIVNCIKSLDNKQVPILVIDNGSCDKTLEVIKRLNSNIKIHNLKENLGWGNSANYGINLVTTKYALLLNPDIKFVSEQPINNFEIKFKKYMNIGMASCITLDENNNPEDGRLTFYSNLIKKKVFKSNIPVDDACSVINCVYGGAIIFFETKKFRLIDGFDKNCFLYLEEDDLRYRVSQKKLTNMIFPSIKAVHYGSSSSKIPNLTWWKNWHWAWSEFYFKKKYFLKSNNISLCLKVFKWFLKSLFYYFINPKKYFLYSGRFNGGISFLIGKKAMNNTPNSVKNNAKGFFGKIKLNKNENYTLSK